MKRSVGIIVLAAIFSGNFVLAGEGDDQNDKSGFSSGPAYLVNNEKSTLYWEGSKPGGGHHGTIEVIGGTADTEGTSITGGSFEIDMTSIKNEDMDNEGRKDKLVGHLKSEDFFYVEKYPVAKFEITSVNESKSTSTVIVGNLTIRGITQEISFPAEISVDDQTIHAKSGEIVLDRTRWDVNHKSKSVFAELKDNFIGDEMIIKLDIHLSRN